MKEAALVKGFGLTREESGFRVYKSSNGLRINCYRSAAGPTGDRLYRRIRDALDGEFTPYFTGGGTDEWRRTINIASRDSRLIANLLRREMGNGDDILAVLPGHQPQPLSALPASGFSHLLLLCIEKRDENSEVYVCSWIEINVWKEAPSYSKEAIFETSAFSPHFRRIRAKTLEKMLSERVDVNEIDVGLSAFPKFPIDVVYTWVDDKDSAWQAERATYSGRQAPVEDLSRANLDERFTNRDELRYSLRSIEMFAPFVRTIYLVTCGHVPKWLQTDHPRLRVVPHDQIYADKAHLPTFNSSSIETQLHHIEGLSEHFLYFNDDFFLGDFCLPQDFFHANGALKSFVTEQKAYERDIDETSEEYIAADGNAIRLMKQHFGSYTRDLMLHAPYPSSRSLLQEMEQTFPKEFEACASKRFRSHDDLRPIAFMQYHYGFQKRRSMPASITNRYLALWKPSIDRLFNEILDNRRFKTFCINDVGIPPSRVNWTNRQVAQFLAAYYPFKSSFEK